jgi:hypothetical protein
LKEASDVSSPYVINQINQTFDLVTHVRGDNCPIDKAAAKDVKTSRDFLEV